MESLSFGPASSEDFSNKNRDNMSSSSESSTAKDESNNKYQSNNAGTDVIIESTAKQDMVPTMLVITGSTDIADLESTDVNRFDLTNAMTPNSTQSNTAF
eukprot:7222039-Ditylum_brightwellii.AAC.1